MRTKINLKFALPLMIGLIAGNSSCDEATDTPAEKNTLTFKVDTQQDRVDEVTAFVTPVGGTQTSVKLERDPSNKSTWFGEMEFEKTGSYTVIINASQTATFHSQDVSRRLVKIREDTRQINNGMNILEYSNFAGDEWQILYDTPDFTFQIPASPCAFGYSIKTTHAGVKIDYIYFDRFFWTPQGNVGAYTFDEKLSGVDLDATGMYKGQLPGVNTNCAAIAQESAQIDSQASISISEGDRVHDYYIGDQMK